MSMELLDISVLYVEDADLIRVPASNIIKSKAQRVTVAEDGVKGLAAFEANPVDIVITDISMPNMDGLEMSRRIKEMSPDTIIIITTAFDDSKYLLSSIEIGIDQYLLKSSLKAQIPLALDKWYVQIIAERRKRAENDFVYHLSKSLIEDTEGIVSVVNMHGMFEFVNKRFCEVNRYSEEEVIGQNPRILRSGKHSTEYYANMYRTLENKQKWSGEFINQRKDGSLYRESAVVFPVLDQSGETAYYVKSSFYLGEYSPANESEKEKKNDFSGSFFCIPVQPKKEISEQKQELIRILNAAGLFVPVFELTLKND